MIKFVKNSAGVWVPTMSSGIHLTKIKSFNRPQLFAHIYIYTCIFVYIFVYMLAIAAQTAGPNWLKFFLGNPKQN